MGGVVPQPKILNVKEAAAWLTEAVKRLSPQKSRGFSVGKLGTSEFNALIHYYARKKSTSPPAYSARTIKEITVNAGLWAPSGKTIHEAIDAWAEETIQAVKNLDGAVLWNPQAPQAEQKLFEHLNPTSEKLVLRGLEPYYTPEDQYTQHMLAGPIAVVSPFANSIKNQWTKINTIYPQGGFAGSMWNTEAQTLIPIKSLYGPHMTTGNTSLTWNQEILDAGPSAAVQHLADQVQASGARYAFVGIGAISLPLVNTLKQRGIIAIHTGGGTQIMFGVKGSRWLNHSVISTFFNDTWIRPLPEEIPSDAEKVEGGCYW
jgi:hypothetical protein